MVEAVEEPYNPPQASYSDELTMKLRFDVRNVAGRTLRILQQQVRRGHYFGATYVRTEELWIDVPAVENSGKELGV